MPKTPKTYPHSKKPQKTKQKPKAQPKVSLLKSKYYWIALTATILVFILAYGYLTQISVAKELLMLGSILSVLSFAFYLGFRASAGYNKRATFIYAGAAIIGFSIWALMIFAFNATVVMSQIADSIGVDFFAITSFIICMVLGAFIGELIGKNRETIAAFVGKFRK